MSEIRYGLDNPHPLSQLKTELVWEGKYDEYGNRREIDVSSCAMPLQKIETIDEPRSRAEAQGKLFDSKKSHIGIGVTHLDDRSRGNDDPQEINVFIPLSFNSPEW